MTRLRWGLLSTARINDRIVDAAGASDRAEVVAVGGRERARTEEYARERGIARAHGSYEELLADPEVDAVYVSVPNSLHVPWTIRALEAGKHVLCEKPFSRRAADVEAAYAAADSAGLVLMEAFMYRHHPQTLELSRLIASGAIGEPRLVRAVFAFNGVRIFGDSGNIRFDPELDGGALMDVGSYCVSSARLVAGEPVRVYGTSVEGPTGVDLAFAGSLEFAGGVVAQFECGFTVEARTELEVLGTDGRLLVREPWRIVEPGIELWARDDHRSIPIDAADSYRCQIENFAGAVAGEQPPLLDRDDAVAQARVLEALTESAATGTAVRLAASQAPSAA